MKALHGRIARVASLLLFSSLGLWPLSSSAAVLKKDHGTMVIKLETAEDVSNDSGWRPLFEVAGVKAEIRYHSSKRGNLFSLEMNGAAYLDTETRELWFEGQPNAGMATMDIGYELGAELKLTLRGKTYEIPLIERDYRFDPKSVAFTPYLFGQGLALQDRFSNPSLVSKTYGLGGLGLYLVGLKVGLGWNGVFSNQFGTWGVYTDLTMDDPFSGDQSQALGKTEKKQIAINNCQVKVDKINAMLFSQSLASIYPDLRLGFIYLFQTIEIEELEGAQPLAMPYLAAPTMIPAVAVPQAVDFCVCSLKLFYPASGGYPVYKNTAGDGTALYEVSLEATSPQGASYSARTPVVEKACSETWLTSDPAPTPTQFAIGTSHVNWLAADKAGAERRLKLSVTVADTTPPDLVPPDDILLETKSAKDKIPVDLGEPTVRDINPVTVVNDAPQDGFPAGRTIVNWTASDSYGNRTTKPQSVTILSAVLSPTLPKPPPADPDPLR